MHNAATPQCSSKIHMRDFILPNHYTETFFMGFDRVKKREKESLRDSINSRYITVFYEAVTMHFSEKFFQETAGKGFRSIYRKKVSKQVMPGMSGTTSSEALKLLWGIDVYVVEKKLFRNVGSTEISLRDDVSETVVSSA